MCAPPQTCVAPPSHRRQRGAPASWKRHWTRERELIYGHGGQRACMRVVGPTLKSTVSIYLVDRIKRSRGIEVMTETEVVAVHGSATVESVTLVDRRDGSTRDVPSMAVFVMIGADPCTEATTTMLPVDPRATSCAAPALLATTATSTGPCPTETRTCSRPRAQGCSPRRRARGRGQPRGGGGRRRHDGRAVRAHVLAG